MAVDNIKAVLKVGAAGANLVEALVDGFQLKDIGPILSFAKSLPGGISSAKAALEEYMKMSDQEALPLESWIESEYDLQNNDVEQVIEQILKVVIQLHDLAALLKPKS